MDRAKLWSWSKTDWARGLIVAIITAPLTIIYESVSKGALVFDWKAIVAAAITGGIAYLLKNLATGAKGTLLTNSDHGGAVLPIEVTTTPKEVK
jgi:hypothetical protein